MEQKILIEAKKLRLYPWVMVFVLAFVMLESVVASQLLMELFEAYMESKNGPWGKLSPDQLKEFLASSSEANARVTKYFGVLMWIILIFPIFVFLYFMAFEYFIYRLEKKPILKVNQNISEIG